jgi:NAD(P)-dependent dehydrogenase (short-subunit alcohol dehydrogenase family)
MSVQIPGEGQNTMQGKIVVITGANSGIGKETASALAKKGATVVMACRNLPKAAVVCESIQRESGNLQVEVMRLDLASNSSIREFSSQLTGKYPRLDVLINNAGIFNLKRHETEDGFEKTMGVNYFGPFLLTNLLLPLIVQTPAARIVNVGSDAHFSGQIDLDDLNYKKKYPAFGFKAYGTSRLATVFFTQELAERLNDRGIPVNALHPGTVATNIWIIGPNSEGYQKLINRITRSFMLSPEEGAQTSIYLASSDEVKDVTGKYFYKSQPKDVSPQCKDVQLQKDLWQISEKLTGLA